MKSVTYIRTNSVVKYGMGPIALDVVRESAVLREAAARCPPQTVPAVTAIEWVSFVDTASSRPLQVACYDSGLHSSHASGYCIEFRVDGARCSIDDVILCDSSRRSIRAALGLTNPLEPIYSEKPGCCCTACKHDLNIVEVGSDAPWSAFTAPGSCIVAECRSSDQRKLLTMLLPKDPTVCGAVMTIERVPGITAAQAARLHPDRIPDISQAVFEALSRLHTGHVVHNDSKLDNFVVDLKTMVAVCIDLELGTTPSLPAHHLVGVVADAAGIELEWSEVGQKCDVTQACVAFHELCGSSSPGFCSSIATLAKPFQVDGHLKTPIYFRRCAASGFVPAATAATAVKVEARDADDACRAPIRP